MSITIDMLSVKIKHRLKQLAGVKTTKKESQIHQSEYKNLENTKL